MLNNVVRLSEYCLRFGRPEEDAVNSHSKIDPEVPIVNVSEKTVKLKPNIFSSMKAGIPVTECVVWNCPHTKSGLYPVCKVHHIVTEGELTVAVNNLLRDSGSSPLREPRRTREEIRLMTRDLEAVEFAKAKIMEGIDEDRELASEIVEEFRGKADYSEEDIGEIIQEAKSRLEATGWIPIKDWGQALDEVVKVFRQKRRASVETTLETARMILKRVFPGKKFPEETIERLYSKASELN